MAEVFGLQADDLPEGWQAVDAVVIVKCIRPDGSDFPYAMCSRMTDGMTPWETAGMADWVRVNALADISD